MFGVNTSDIRQSRAALASQAWARYTLNIKMSRGNAMGLPAFDTHAYVKRLKLVGFTDAQAEAQSELQAEVLSSLVTEQLSTKDDLLRLETRLKQDIAAFAAETKQEFIRHDAKITKLDIKFNGKFNQLYWMLAFLLATNVTVLIKLFHG